MKETLQRDLKDQTGHSRKNIEKKISCRLIKTRKQENASHKAIACNTIQDINKSGKRAPNTDPCGTAHVISASGL